MSLEPLLNASLAIRIHAFTAFLAFGVGIVQLSAPKGTIPHRLVGWGWAALMMAVAISSFWIHELRMIGPWSPIHLLSLWVLIAVPLAAYYARIHAVERHRRFMRHLFMWALVLAGLFTFYPGRIMHQVVFGS